MDTVFTSAPFMLFLVMASYLIGSKLYRKTGIALLHPLNRKYSYHHIRSENSRHQLRNLPARKRIHQLPAGPFRRRAGLHPVRPDRTDQRKSNLRPVRYHRRRYRRHRKRHTYLPGHGSRRPYNLFPTTQIGNHPHCHYPVGTFQRHPGIDRYHRIPVRIIWRHYRTIRSRQMPHTQQGGARAGHRSSSTRAGNCPGDRARSHRRSRKRTGNRTYGCSHFSVDPCYRTVSAVNAQQISFEIELYYEKITQKLAGTSHNTYLCNAFR